MYLKCLYFVHWCIFLCDWNFFRLRRFKNVENLKKSKTTVVTLSCCKMTKERFVHNLFQMVYFAFVHYLFPLNYTCFIHPFINIYSFIYSFIHRLFRHFTVSFIYWYVSSFASLFVHSFTHTHSFDWLSLSFMLHLRITLMNMAHLISLFLLGKFSTSNINNFALFIKTTNLIKSGRWDN